MATAVTSIGIDHTGYLGTKLTDIAREKAGIVKPGVPCFVGRLPDEADAVIAGVAAAAGAPLARVGRDFVLPRSPVALAGAHQRSNAAIAVALARAAAESLGKPLDDGAIAAGLASVQWPGRLEAVADDVWLDCAHNVEAARALAAALPTMLRGRRVVLLMSIVDDKDPAGMFAALGRASPAAVVVTRSSNPRALPIHTLMAAARPCFPGAEVSGHDEPLDALAAARARAARDRGAWSSRAARSSWSASCAPTCAASPWIRCRRRTRSAAAPVIVAVLSGHDRTWTRTSTRRFAGDRGEHGQPDHRGDRRCNADDGGAGEVATPVDGVSSSSRRVCDPVAEQVGRDDGGGADRLQRHDRRRRRCQVAAAAVEVPGDVADGDEVAPVEDCRRDPSVQADAPARQQQDRARQHGPHDIGGHADQVAEPRRRAGRRGPADVPQVVRARQERELLDGSAQRQRRDGVRGFVQERHADEEQRRRQRQLRDEQHQRSSATCSHEPPAGGDGGNGGGALTPGE